MIPLWLAIAIYLVGGTVAVRVLLLRAKGNRRSDIQKCVEAGERRRSTYSHLWCSRDYLCADHREHYPYYVIAVGGAVLWIPVLIGWLWWKVTFPHGLRTKDEVREIKEQQQEDRLKVQAAEIDRLHKLIGIATPALEKDRSHG